MKGSGDLALKKREYIDGETVITAENMNDIQDEIIANRDAIEALQSQAEAQSGIVSAIIE